jgi:death-on-curing protein
MKEPAWITRLMVDVIHTDQMQQHGGVRGVRDEDVLESVLALARDRWTRDPGIDRPALAAVYGCGLVRGRPYNDGNTRTAFLVMHVFLGLNGLDFNAPELDIVRGMRSLAEHRLTEAALAEWIKTV